MSCKHIHYVNNVKGERLYSPQDLLDFLQQPPVVDDSAAPEYLSRQQYLDGPALYTARALQSDCHLIDRYLVGYCQSNDSHRQYLLIVPDMLIYPLVWEDGPGGDMPYRLLASGPYYREVIESVSQVARNENTRLVALGPLPDLICHLPLPDHAMVSLLMTSDILNED